MEPAKKRSAIETYFVRHNSGIDIDAGTRRRLWKEQPIAIHHPWDISGDKKKDISSVNPDNYVGSAKQAMNRTKKQTG